MSFYFNTFKIDINCEYIFILRKKSFCPSTFVQVSDYKNVCNYEKKLRVTVVFYVVATAVFP